MPNYKNGKVYKIVCNTTGKIYIGSTTQLLCRRLAEHVNDNKRGKGITSKEILDGRNYSIVLIENIECETKEQLLRKEREYIETLECVNKCKRPIISIDEKKEKLKEYLINNKEKKALRDKEYQQINKDKIKEYQKEYNKVNKEKRALRDKEYQQINKDKITERKKMYRNNNKDKIVEKAKEYYELNKENIIQRKKEYRLKKKQEKQQAIELAIEELHIAVERVPE